MKRNFTETPEAWMRAHRVYQSPADYASPVEVFASKGHAAATYVGVVVMAVLAVLLLAGAM